MAAVLRQPFQSTFMGVAYMVTRDPMKSFLIPSGQFFRLKIFSSARCNLNKFSKCLRIVVQFSSQKPLRTVLRPKREILPFQVFRPLNSAGESNQPQELLLVHNADLKVLD